MYSKLPQLLLYRTHNLRNKTAAIAEALGLNPVQADQLVRSDPRLMTYAPETLQQRAVALQELLQLPGQPALRKVVLGWPSLLRKRTQSIAGGGGRVGKMWPRLFVRGEARIWMLVRGGACPLPRALLAGACNSTIICTSGCIAQHFSLSLGVGYSATVHC